MGTYTIQAGDTLQKIADNYGTTVEDIARDNNIQDVNMIIAGNSLNIKQPNEVVNTQPSYTPPQVEETDLSSYEGNPDTYTIKTGDTLYQIAQNFNMSIDDLIRINNITDPNMIYAGNVLKLKEDAPQQIEVLTTPEVPAADAVPSPVPTGPVLAQVEQPIERLEDTREISTADINAGSLNAIYTGVLRHKRSASPECIAAQGVLTYDNKKYIVGTDRGDGVLTQQDYFYLVGQVCGEAALDTDDMLGVACTILNNMEYTSDDVKTTLQKSYWPWGKTCDRFINYDGSGNPTGFKTIEQIGEGEFQKLQQVIKVVSDAMNGVRNVNKETRFYAGDGTHNYFSDSYL